MNQARKFLEERINLFFTDPLKVEVVSTSGYEVSYRNVLSQAYKAYHKQFLRNEHHHETFVDYVSIVCPNWFDKLTWNLSMHQDQRLLILN